MQDVELDDGPGPVDASPARRTGRRRWWLPAVAAAVLLGVVGVQLVADARERAAVARLAQVPGILAPVHETLPVVWRSQAVGQALWSVVVVGGALLGPSVDDDDGSQRLVARDLATGKVLWTTELFGPDPGRAAAMAQDGASVPECVPTTVGPEPARLACLVSDGYVVYGQDGQVTDVPATQTFVRVVDTADGSPVAQWAADGGSLAVLDDVAVLATYDADAGITLDGRDLSTGEQRWTARVPPPAGDVVGWSSSWPPYVYRVGDYLAVFGFDGGSELFDATGRSPDDELVGGSDGPRAGQFQELPGSGRVVFSSQGEPGLSSSVVLADDRPGFAFDGDPVVPTFDDGSLPDLLLVAAVVAPSDGGGGTTVLTGRDAETGDGRWTSEVVADYQFPGALVMRGKVFLQTTDGLAAVDGRTGEKLWTAPSPKSSMFGELMTDGHHLLVTLRNASDGRIGDLVALDPATGETDWRSRVPDGIESYYPVGGALLGVRTDAFGNATEVVRFG